MAQKAKYAAFIKSAADAAGFPREDAPEIAFAGRSNVGKSSLINTLTGKKGLARASSTPGRTRLLNWFDVTAPGGQKLAFVDLPGYGYAKVPREMRASWRPLMESFMTARAVLKLVIVIIDIRRGPEEEEADLIEWLHEIDKPVQVVLTKADKVAKNQRFPAVAATKRSLTLRREPLVFSAETGEGVDELWKVILKAAVSGTVV